MDPAYLMNLVGKQVSVSDSTNPRFLGVNGTIIDETKNTISIASGAGRVMIPKETCRFRITSGSTQAELLGRAIMFRQEDRIKEYRKIGREIEREVGR